MESAKSQTQQSAHAHTHTHTHTHTRTVNHGVNLTAYQMIKTITQEVGNIGERVRDGGRGCEGRDEWILRGR